jgi:CRISPR-associated RAMP protein (TIGR02581 family)
MFHRFKNRIEIRAILITKTPLYIGAGQENFEPLATQGSVIKDNLGRPFVPGSSIKGVLRSFLESVSQDGGANGVCERGEGCPRAINVTDKKGRDQLIKELKETYPSSSDDKLEEMFAAEVERQSCLACQLFGSSVLAGKVKFADAILRNPELWLGTDTRTGNAIDRDTHTAASDSGALFDTEVVPAGTDFIFRVIAENLTANQARYLTELITYFGIGGITLGGRSRSGLGQVELENVRLRVSYLREGEFMPLTTSFKDTEVDGILSALEDLVPSQEVFAKEVQSYV